MRVFAVPFCVLVCLVGVLTADSCLCTQGHSYDALLSSFPLLKANPSALDHMIESGDSGSGSPPDVETTPTPPGKDDYTQGHSYDALLSLILLLKANPSALDNMIESGDSGSGSGSGSPPDVETTPTPPGKDEYTQGHSYDALLSLILLLKANPSALDHMIESGDSGSGSGSGSPPDVETTPTPPGKDEYTQEHYYDALLTLFRLLKADPSALDHMIESGDSGSGSGSPPDVETTPTPPGKDECYRNSHFYDRGDWCSTFTCPPDGVRSKAQSSNSTCKLK